VQKLWGVLFGVVLLACFVLTAVALLPAAVPGSMVEQWGLPSNVAEKYGASVDWLFYLILAFVTFFFVLTEVILVIAMVRFVRQESTRRATYTHGHHQLELAWTIVPAAILLYIAYAQIHTWEDIKYQSHFPDPDQVVQVTAAQWEWDMRYRAEQDADGATWRHNLGYPANDQDRVEKLRKEKEWGERPQFDDVQDIHDLHTWKDAKVKVLLKTNDIIHSFFLPNLRLKQDALPGKTIPMWFEANDWNAKFDPATGVTEFRREPNKNEYNWHWEIACAELCGEGHYRMRRRLFVHETKADYEAWLTYAKKNQNMRTPNPAGTE
jgi:cytochrome c oxidase subunit 2